MLGPYLLEWTSLLLRWLHVITAIAWIGSSFFFMHLDASLRRVPELAAGGSAWQVHGGGFYEMRKHFVAPEAMPRELTWHKWQSYWTWISGFFLLTLVYYGQSELYLIDPAVRLLTPIEAALIGIGGIASGWLVYDGLCRWLVGRHDALLTGLVFLLVVAGSWIFSLVFSGRGTLIHTGALMATMMTGNVFLNIIPNQKKVVADLIAGVAPNPAFGKQAKQRSTHNNYLTLPVILFMISNHYPSLYANSFVIPLVVALVLVSGGLIRYFFNLRHASHGQSSEQPWWAWAVATVAIWTAFWVAMAASPGGRERLGLPPATAGKTSAIPEVPATVANIVMGRCSMCHAAEPFQEGIHIAPKNVRLDTPDAVALHSPAIRLQAVLTHAMPPNNVSGMTMEERRVLATWLATPAEP